MALRPPVLLTALLLEDPDLGGLAVAIYDADDAGARDERRAGHQLPGVLADQKDLIERDLRALIMPVAADFDDGTRLDAELPARCLNDRKHYRLSRGKRNFPIYHGGSRRRGMAGFARAHRGPFGSASRERRRALRAAGMAARLAASRKGKALSGRQKIRALPFRKPGRASAVPGERSDAGRSRERGARAASR